MLIWPIPLSVWRLHRDCRAHSFFQPKQTWAQLEHGLSCEGEKINKSYEYICFHCLHMCKAREQSLKKIWYHFRKMTELVLHLGDSIINFRCFVAFVWFALESGRDPFWNLNCELCLEVGNQTSVSAARGFIIADAWSIVSWSDGIYFGWFTEKKKK